MSSKLNFPAGLWRLADPKISITSVAAMAIGAALAYRDGSTPWGWLALTLLALFCFEVAKNAWGDVIDFDSGTDLAVKPEDRTDFSGGKRVLVDELLTRRQTWSIAIVFGAAGALLGMLIVLGREPGLFWLGLAGVLLAWSYHGPPLQLAYRGLGELDVALCYGPLISMGTYVVCTQGYNSDVIWASLPLGLFIAAFLWVNEFPDFEADRSVGKNNLVVRLGRHRASRLLPVIYLLASLILLGACALEHLPPAAALGLVALLPATAACSWIWREPDSFYRHKPVQPMALLAFVILAAGIAVGTIYTV
ncbi:MAG: prenyltransferase [Halieaceae bacterium]